ncbi:hypothetical protein CW751_14610 [Brumimicrobium salinarum]|uniref:Uncharacterized protein n=1 Tax=Brumimicrobium salinarum TaxID=2058658 RepID=A0A2I0QYZ6_9FLAO|nr:hypothetical protein [Brumimicrobium salinarum]PKR79529.1 hypothetical protein CW751_14610 [Brumimicrobium salinarum]
MKILNLLTLLILLTPSSPSFLWAQGNADIASREKFIKNYAKQIDSRRDNNVQTFIEQELAPFILDPSQFPERHFQQMTATIDLLIEKRHAAYPHTYQYVQSVYSMLKKGKKNEEFNTWHEIVDQLADNRNPRRIRDFLETSSNFLYDQIIANDPNYKWFCIGGDFEFINNKTPFIKLKNTTLICKTVNRGSNKREHPFSDSIKISKTSGTANLTRNKWEGNGGTYTWEKVGLNKDETNAELNNYEISFRSTNLSADSVILTTPYVNQKITGKLVDRAMKGSIGKANDIPYPQFMSYQANFEIKDLIKGVDYNGGFSLQADEFVGIGNQNKRAQLTYYRKEKIFATTFSDIVRVNEKTVSTPMAKSTLYIGLNDSITHTGLNVIYERSNETLRFIRGNSPMTQAPFINSFHQLHMYVDELSWDNSTNALILGYNLNTSEQQRIARFESFDYYDARLFQQLQGMESVNPIVALYNYAYKYDKFEMTEGTAATALNRTIQQAKPKLLELSTLGFISYDTDRGVVVVNQKTEHFVKSKSGKSDYDNISFKANLAPIRIDNTNGKDNRELQAKINKRNQERSKIRQYGTIDLSSLELDVVAVDLITIAENKNTTIFPKDNKVKVKKNRNIVFSGWINSGKWEVKVQKGNYSYEDNKFNIFESDIALFKAKPQRKEDGERLIPTQSFITGLKGELIVDDVKNRSGIKKGFDQYPILNSKEKTKVFYSQKQLHLGAYDEERFYFEIDPFTIDSLLTFDDEFLRFKGTLTSAGIFPKIDEELKLMPDYSLGFSQKAPAEGYPFYGTDARYENKILLSNNGLQGGGTINFLNSSSTSKRLFSFLPDSTIGVASFVNKPQVEGVEFPDVEGPDVFISFLPRKQTLKASSNNELISFFDGEANLRGTTVLRGKGMKGNGILELKDAKMGSDNFRFSRWKALADTASFQLTNKYKKEGDLTEDPLAFKTDNVNGDLNFEERKGVFKSNEGESVVEFPVNQYICKIDQFTWLMDNDELTLEKKEEDNLAIEGAMDLVGPNFYSTHPKQDSLQFRSPKAKFNLKERTIYAYETEFLEIADARIYPDSSKVVIRKNAKMEEFKDAKIIANYITKFHTIVNVSAKVTARRAYTATGDYEYGLEGEEKELIALTEIKLDSSYQTVAKGEIAQDQSFKLSERFNFYGKTFLKAAEERLTFEGATQINHNCDKFERNWMAFKTDIDPGNIQIPVSKNMKDLDGNKITVGIRWRNASNTDSVSLYPTFLSSVDNDDDPEVISASGYLQFNESAKEFQISNKEKLINRSATGNYISLHTESCSMNGDGKISLGMDYGPLETEAVGVINYNQENEQTDLNLTLAIRAPMNEKELETVAGKIRAVEGLSDADFNSTTLEQALVEWTGLKSADKIKSDYTLKKEFKSVPKAMRDAIVISGLRLSSYTKSGNQQRGLKSSTDNAIIVNIYNEPIMKYVPTKFFAEQRANFGDRLGVMFDVPGAYLYYFDYDYRKDGIMNIFSSDAEFMKEVSDLKSDKKKTKKFSYDVTKNSAYSSQFLRVFK